ncbi:MAG: hypothetical protein WDM80_02480 [Limisphaerales bacterium]
MYDSTENLICTCIFGQSIQLFSNMSRLQQDIDDLDRMVDTGAQKDAIRSQIRLISREVSALEIDFTHLAENLENLQATQIQQSVSAPVDAFEHRRGLFYKTGDPIPFCPHCFEADDRKIHLSGPVPMMDESIEYWECYTCDHDYHAKQGGIFLASQARPGRRRRK